MRLQKFTEAGLHQFVATSWYPNKRFATEKQTIISEENEALLLENFVIIFVFGVIGCTGGACAFAWEYVNRRSLKVVLV